MGVEAVPRTIWWEDGAARGAGADGAGASAGKGSAAAGAKCAICFLDQTRLPLSQVVVRCTTVGQTCDAIKALVVRGAPALGITAALALALWAKNEPHDGGAGEFMEGLRAVEEQVANARPTAVNLSWGAKRALERAQSLCDEGASVPQIADGLLSLGLEMMREDELCNRRIGEHGTSLLAEGSQVLTHCNAGSLATAYYGTALGVIYSGFAKGRVSHVWVDETRPVNQGGRLTAWELARAGIPATLICDNMAASVMRGGYVDAVVVGADRICANGDTANKIGTYGLAVLAREHRVPFYVAAPLSTIDSALECGEQIEIEERDQREVEGFSVSAVIDPATPTERRAIAWLTQEGDASITLKGGHSMKISRMTGGALGAGAGGAGAGGDAGNDDGFLLEAWFKNTPQGVNVYNPAFDVTPARYIAGIITEVGVLRKGADGVYHLKDAHSPSFTA